MDAGAVIAIVDSVFKDSKFCKGMIVYREQQTYSLDDNSQFLNMTNFELLETDVLPWLTISGSTFQNLGFTQTLDSISLPGEFSSYLVQDLLYFDYFFNKGLALNMENWKGFVYIESSQFLENMYNIPGLAYQPYSEEKLSMDILPAYSEYYSEGQLYCLGRLIPLLEQSTDT